MGTSAGWTPKFDAVIGVLGDAKQLDAVAEFFGKLNVFGFQMCNAFDMNFRHIDPERRKQ